MTGLVNHGMFENKNPPSLKVVSYASNVPGLVSSSTLSSSMRSFTPTHKQDQDASQPSKWSQAYGKLIELNCKCHPYLVA